MPLSFRPGWASEHPDELEALLADRLEYPTRPYENGVELARRIPGSRFEAFPGSGHLLFIEEAPRFNAMVTSFLTG